MTTMNVGILTTFFSRNYGAVLQAYATGKAVESLGCTAEFVNYQKEQESYYRPEAYVKEQGALPLTTKLRRKIKNAFIKMKAPNAALAAGMAIRDEAVEVFLKQCLDVSLVPYRSTEDFLEAVPAMPYDVFLCGSDQICSPLLFTHTKNTSPSLFLHLSGCGVGTGL